MKIFRLKYGLIVIGLTICYFISPKLSVAKNVVSYPNQPTQSVLSATKNFNASLIATTSASMPRQNLPSSAPDEIIVKYKDGQAPEDLQILVNQRKEASIVNKTQAIVNDIITKISGNKTPEEKLLDIQKVENETGMTTRKKVFTVNNEKARKIGLQNIRQIKTNKNLSVDQLIAKYQVLPEVIYAEKNSVLHASYLPNDPGYTNQWALSQIQMNKAWDIATGSSTTTVAVLDTGVDYNHDEFKGGRVVLGQNYIGNNMLPMDDNDHGTHVAGIIAATMNNNVGVGSIASYVKILAVKVLDNTGLGYDAVVAAGITYATNNAANIINLSLGTHGACSQTMQNAIDYAYASNVTVVAAVENLNSNFDTTPTTPASCNHVISVAAVGPTNTRASYSDYGSNIDIAAPGGDSLLCGSPYTTCEITSTVRNNLYGLMQGTSMATAHVSGLAALMYSRNNNLTPDQIKTIIKANNDDITPDLNKPLGSNKSINAYKVLLNTPLRIPLPTFDITPNVSTTVAWSIPEATTSATVDYGWNTNYEFTTGALDTSPMINDHSLSLPTLAPCQTLFMKAKSKDFWGIETISADNTIDTTGCNIATSITNSSAAKISSLSGGLTNLVDPNTGTGILLSIPATFSATDADFQIKQFDSASALPTIAIPVGYVPVGNYLYEAKAFPNVSTAITSFTHPVTVTITYSDADVASVNESALYILRWNGSSWTKLTGCTADTNANKLSCPTSNFSDFGLFTDDVPVELPTATPTPTPIGPTATPTPTPVPIETANSSSPNNPDFSTPSCTGFIPNAPTIYQIVATTDKAFLHFVPSSSSQDTYTMSYGLYSSADMYNVTFIYTDKSGAIPYTINDLAASTTYYFKIRANNGCMPGEWSNTLAIKTTSSSSTSVASYAFIQSPKTGSLVLASALCTQYTVLPGDSIWAIASKILGAGTKYLQVWEDNKGRFPTLKYSPTIRTGWVLYVGC